MFHFFNPNPRHHFVGDCVIRALCAATNLSWNEVYDFLVAVGKALGDLPSSNYVWGTFLLSLGFHIASIPNTCPNCYTVKDFCKDNPYGIYILGTGTHAVTVIDGNYYDSWDSGNEVPRYVFWRDF